MTIVRALLTKYIRTLTSLPSNWTKNDKNWLFAPELKPTRWIWKSFIGKASLEKLQCNGDGPWLFCWDTKGHRIQLTNTESELKHEICAGSILVWKEKLSALYKIKENSIVSSNCRKKTSSSQNFLEPIIVSSVTVFF